MEGPNTFSLGQSKAATQEKKKNLEEKRMAAFNIGAGSKNDHKKERENYAVKLRKSKKEEMFQ